jgi:integrase
MPTIVKTPSGTWKALVRKQGFPQVIKTFRLKRDAEDWARSAEDEMTRGTFVNRAPAERLTFGAAMKRYLAEVSATKRTTTQRTEKGCSAPLLEAFKSHSLASITPESIAAYRDRRLAGEDRPKDGRPVPRAPNTVRLELALLGHLFTVAMKEWRIGLAQNPVLSIRRPAAGVGRNRRFAAGEELRLLKRVDQHSNPMLRWIVRIAIETSMRSSEITGLRTSQVDIAKRVVRLENTKNTSPRTVPLSKTATALFREALANPLRPKDCELVFFGEPGRDKLRRPYNFNKVWLELKVKAGMKDLRFHDLRHEAVSRFVEAGFSDQEVSAISGHKSMQMLKRYTHLRAEDLVKKLDKDLREVAPPP